MLKTSRSTKRSKKRKKIVSVECPPHVFKIPEVKLVWRLVYCDGKKIRHFTLPEGAKLNRKAFK